MSSSLASPVSQQQILYVSGNQMREALSPTAAVNALQSVLEVGLDPELDAPRTRVNTSSGLFLQMPSTWQDIVGTKLLTITEANAAIGEPVIQGLYAIFGGESQAPLAIIDGIELTNLRTSAVSALGARLVSNSPSKELLVFGTGVQAWAHIRTFADVFGISKVRVVGRNPENARALIDRVSTELGLDGDIGSVADVSEADLIVCCTASSEPLFDGNQVRDHAVVVAMGAHDPTSRELDDVLLQRANVVVESRDSAMREAGDVIQAIDSGAIRDATELLTLAEVVSGVRKPMPDRPTVFKTTGMPWQDLIIARSVLEVLHTANALSEEALSSNA
ncbi:ornithine cyclodeaminase family protein [Paeniglutamicibacter gangotriensis]|uniref:ornithine cyclodeaminase family protein n=1 Tax=Paeniglutamicibacter gangotriensis TaxID=254787 RepID=UPI0021CE526A|nr:ornithine cyclodeaminase family protein [Paeniglutamicibacter gangotriensis]